MSSDCPVFLRFFRDLVNFSLAFFRLFRPLPPPPLLPPFRLISIDFRCFCVRYTFPIFPLSRTCLLYFVALVTNVLAFFVLAHSVRILGCPRTASVWKVRPTMILSYS
jgi:hypothetical protein